MAIIQFPRQEPGPTLGARIGAGASEGLSEGIGALIDMKLERMKKKQTIDSLSDSFKGLVQQRVISEEEAPMLANMAVETPQAFNMFMKDKMQAARNRQFAEQQNQARGLDALQGMRGEPGLQSQPGGIQQQPMEAQQQAVGAQPTEEAPYRYDPNLTMHENVSMDIAQQNRQIKKKQMEQQRSIAEQKLFQDQRKISLTETRSERTSVREDAKNARQKLNIIKRAIGLVDKKGLDNPLARQVMNKLGIDFEALRTGDTKAFETLMSSLSMLTLSGMKGVKSKHAMDLVEQLGANSFQTDAQKRQLLEIQANLQALPIIRNDMQNQLMKEYDGEVLPDNFFGILDDKMVPYEDNIVNSIANLAGTQSPVEGQLEQAQAMAANPLGVTPAKKEIPKELQIPKAKPRSLKPGEMSPEEKKNEKWSDFIGRQVARPIIKGGASAGGFPGDIINTGKSIVEYGLSKATGQDIKLPDAAINIPLFTPFLEMTKLGLNKALGTKLDFPTSIPIPTSQGIQNVIKAVGKIFSTPEDAKKIDKMMTPQNQAEQVVDNVVEMVAPMLLFPISGAGTGIAKGASTATKVGKTALRGLKIAGLSETAGLLAQSVGVGEKGVAAIKLGTVMAASLGGAGSLRKVIKKGWNDDLDKVIWSDRLRKTNIANEENLRRAQAALKARQPLTSVKPVEIDNKFFKLAPKQAMLAELDEANKIKNFLGNNLDFLKGKNKLFKALFAWTNPMRAAKTYAIGKVLTGVGTVGASLSLLKKYPFLRKLYVDSIKAAARGDARLLIKHASKLNEATGKIKD